VLAWTWLTKDDGHWTHPPGARVRRPVSNVGSVAEQELRALMEADEVDTVLFDKVAPWASYPVWDSSSVKLVIWLSDEIA
jgi:hypothetical protein